MHTPMNCELCSMRYQAMGDTYCKICRRAYESRDVEVDRLKVPDAVENAAEHLFQTYSAWGLGGLGTAVSEFWAAWDQWRGAGKDVETCQ